MVFNDKLFPSFGLEMIRIGEKKRSIITNLNDNGIKNISIKPYVFNTDKNSLIWVKYNRSINNNYISVHIRRTDHISLAKKNNKYTTDQDFITFLDCFSYA